jgi:ADP-heptose:LPS heptosyltransferase
MDILLEVQAGIGDMVHVQPAIAKLLQSGIGHIYIFTRPDAIGIYAGNPQITEYSNLAVDVKNKLLGKSNIKCVHISEGQHGGSEHRSKSYLRHICRTTNLSYDENAFDFPVLSVTQEERERAIRFKNTAGASVLIQVDSFRPTKSIPPQLVGDLIQRLLDVKYKVFVISDKPPIRHKNLVWVHGLSIRQLMGIISVMDIVIAPDSAPAWLSVGLGTRTLILFGSTDPRLYAYNKQNCEILITSSECKFCGDHQCRNPICMSGFDIENILDIINGKRGDNMDLQLQKGAYTPEAYPLVKKRKYRLLFIIPYLFLGGGETQLWYLVRQLRKSFVYIDIIVAGNAPTTTDKIMLERLQAYAHVHYKDSRNQDEKTAWVKEQIAVIQPDVIFHHGDIPVSEFICDLIPKPIIMQILHSGGEDRWALGAIIAMDHYNDMVIAVADHIKEKYQDRFPTIRWRTILNGVPEYPNAEPLYRKESDIFNIGILTRLVENKGIEIAIKAMQHLPDEINLLIGGWGAKEKELKTLALPYGNRVRFTGLIIDPENFMNSLDCYLLPSSAEGNSMTILEACMQKKPLVVTSVGAVPELFEDNQSALIISNIPQSLADAVKSLYLSNSLRNSIADSAYKIASTQSTDIIMARQYKDAINDMIAIRTHPKSIAILRIGGAGDVLSTIPMLAYLRKKYPNAEIWYYTFTKHKCLIPEHLVDYIVDITVFYKTFSHNRDYPLGFRDYKPFDLVIRCNHYKLFEQDHTQICDWYLSLVNAPIGDRNMPIDIDKVPDFPTSNKLVVLQRISNNIARDWGTDNDWGQIEDSLKDYEVLYLDGTFKGKQIDFLESGKLISQACLFIGVDSVGIHLANAVGTRAIGIYPSSNPDIAGYDQHIKIESDMKCGRRHCMVNQGEKSEKFECPNNYKCHQGIKVEQVLEAIGTVLF